MKHKPLKSKSAKGKLVAEIDHLFLRILKKERGEKDEIDGRPANGLGMFHILPKGRYPRLRWARQNVLLVNWFPYHFSYHHDNPGHPVYDFVVRRICELRGKDWRKGLLMLEKQMPRQTMSWLRMFRTALRRELKERTDEK